MNVERQQYAIGELVGVFESGQLLRNPEYQRGEAWSIVQKATFIDSVAVASAVGVRLDPMRLFTSDQKVAIRARASGFCGVCGLEVVETDAEYDHYPRLYRDGGPTVPDNGRLVHRACHPRGRPVGS